MKYLVCDDCGTIHTIVRTFIKNRFNCYCCGSGIMKPRLDPPTESESKLQNNYFPVACDWKIQHRVEEAVDRLTKDLLNRHKEISPQLLDDFKTYLVLAVNSKPVAFIREVKRIYR